MESRGTKLVKWRLAPVSCHLFLTSESTTDKLDIMILLVAEDRRYIACCMYGIISERYGWICLLFQMKRRWRTQGSILRFSSIQELHIKKTLRTSWAAGNTDWRPHHCLHSPTWELKEAKKGGGTKWSPVTQFEPSFSFRKHPIIWAIKAGKGERERDKLSQDIPWKTQKKAPAIITSFITHQAANANGGAYSPSWLSPLSGGFPVIQFAAHQVVPNACPHPSKKKKKSLSHSF